MVLASNATNLQGPAVGQPNATFQVFFRDRCLDAGVAIPGCTPSTTLVRKQPDEGLGRAAIRAIRDDDQGRRNRVRRAAAEPAGSRRRRERPERRVRERSLEDRPTVSFWSAFRGASHSNGARVLLPRRRVALLGRTLRKTRFEDDPELVRNAQLAGADLRATRFEDSTSPE